MLRGILPLLLAITQTATLPGQDQTAEEKRQQELAKLRMLAQPGEEHAQLKTLVGSWNVSMKSGGRDTGYVGAAQASMILGDRFLVIDGEGANRNRKSAFRYSIGFDRRHEEYVIVAMDTTGTYYVSGRGKSKENIIRMFGTDDDPHMKKMGLVKKFAFGLDIKGEHEFSVSTFFIDNRTQEEKLLLAYEFVFTRQDAGQ